MIKFKRSESVVEGWQGKKSWTEIALNGRVIGTIKGQQDTSLPGRQMRYRADIDGLPCKLSLVEHSEWFTLAEAKKDVRDALTKYVQEKAERATRQADEHRWRTNHNQ